MRIKKYLNTSEREVYSRQFNIVIGISLGNKYFTKENIREYLLWAITNTKERVAVLIPDKIHAINYEVRNGYREERALKKAIREGEKVIDTVQSVLGEFSPEKQAMVDILRWEEIETREYKKMVSVLYYEFEKNSQFREKIIEIVKEHITSEKYDSHDYEKLATYLLEELPALVTGVAYNEFNYNLLPYPGLSKIDNLKIGLQEGLMFPMISNKLNIESKMRFIEAYADL